MCVRRRKSGVPVQGFPSVDGLLRAMDAAGVARAVLLGWYWNQPLGCVAQNRFYAECVERHPDRLSAFATLHAAMGPKDAMLELKSARDDGLIGLGELSPHSQTTAPDDAALYDVLELAGQWGMPVNLHVTDPKSGSYPGRVETPLVDFVALAKAHPRTTFILAHWGGLLPFTEEGSAPLPNVYYDTAASPLLYDAGIWRRFVEKVGADRVLFGSDFPLNLYPQQSAESGFGRLIDEAKNSGLTAAKLDAVLRGNATRVLKV
jgi:predicted TIM-barrel fold metal-dependent hydrolase